MSRRLVVVNAILRRVGRPLLKRTKSPEKSRRDFELTARFLFRGPRRFAEPAEIGGVPGLDLRPPGSAAAPVILYFHGGGYVTGSPRSHLPMAGRLARMTGARTVLPDYRLAPEHPFPAAFEDAVAAWRGLRQAGVAAHEIVIAGDSAGGGLGLSLLAEVLSGGERPAGAFAFSPWTDLTLSGASLDENAARDAILPVERIEEIRGMITPDGDYSDPRLSPLFADFPGAPPVYLQASEAEILRDDTTRIADRIRAQGGEARVDFWPDTPHVWQIFTGWLPEADEALLRVAEFVAERFRASRPQSES